MSTHDPFDFSSSAKPTPVPPSRPERRTMRGAEPGPGRADRDGPTIPPVLWLLGALVAGAAAAVVAFLHGTAVPVALVCWAVAGPGAIGLLAVHAQRESWARTRPMYGRRPWLGPLYVVVVVVVVIGIGTSAWRIADWWGRT